MPILRPLWNQVQTLWPPYGLSFFSVGLHNPHSHPRTLSSWVTIAKVALLFIAVSPAAGLHTLYYHSMAHGWLIPILSGHTFCVTPGGLRGLGLKGGAVPPGVHPAIPPSPLMFPSVMLNVGRGPGVDSVCNNRFPHSPDILPSGRLGLSM